MAKRVKKSGDVHRSLWDRYLANRLSLHARNALVTYYLPLVSAVENRLRRRGSLPAQVTAEQFCSWGVDGLIEAVEKFAPERGVKFETVANALIEYRALDHLRGESWLSRRIVQALKHYERYRADFHAARGCDPTAQEVCRALEWPPSLYREVILAYGRYTASLSQIAFGNGQIPDNKDRVLGELLVNQRAELPQQRVQRSLFFERLTRGLDMEERIIMYLYHVKDRKMREIGAMLDLSESRVSQMHSAILQRIRNRFSADEAFGLLSA